MFNACLRLKKCGFGTDKQQLKAKMLAAGATQALRLFSDPLDEKNSQKKIKFMFLKIGKQ